MNLFTNRLILDSKGKPKLGWLLPRLCMVEDEGTGQNKTQGCEGNAKFWFVFSIECWKLQTQISSHSLQSPRLKQQLRVPQQNFLRLAHFKSADRPISHVQGGGSKSFLLTWLVFPFSGTKLLRPFLVVVDISMADPFSVHASYQLTLDLLSSFLTTCKVHYRKEDEGLKTPSRTSSRSSSNDVKSAFCLLSKQLTLLAPRKELIINSLKPRLELGRRGIRKSILALEKKDKQSESFRLQPWIFSAQRKWLEDLF